VQIGAVSDDTGFGAPSVDFFVAMTRCAPAHDRRTVVAGHRHAALLGNMSGGPRRRAPVSASRRFHGLPAYLQR
jgi:hypothetical protein